MINFNILQQFINLKELCFKFKMLFINKKYIVVLFGHKGIFLSAFLNDKLFTSAFIPFHEDSLDLNLYKSFFYKLRNFDVFFLLDGAECKIRHDFIPILQSIVKTNTINKFIDSYLNKNDIVAHYVYEVTNNPNEIWSTIIMFCPCNAILSDIIEYTLKSKTINFQGIYFLALELNTIINRIIQNIENNKYADYFQVCVFLLESSGIKFIIKHQNNIVAIRNFEYPNNKSDLYIQGIIEQEINDSLILFKNNINNLNNRLCFIFILDNNLQTLLKQTNFNNYPTIFVPVNSILNKTNLLSNKFIDCNLSKLFIKYRKFPAYNNYLNSIKRLYSTKSLIFRIFILTTLILLFITGIIKYKTLHYNKESLFLNEKYYAINQEYEQIKYKYPYVNTTNLADLYVTEKLLETPVVLPFDLLKRLIITIAPSFKLQEIKWELTNIENILFISKRHLRIKILLKYISYNKTVDDTIIALNNHINNLQKKMSDLDISFYIFEDKITDIMGMVVIPLSLNVIDNKR